MIESSLAESQNKKEYQNRAEPYDRRPVAIVIPHDLCLLFFTKAYTYFSRDRFLALLSPRLPAAVLLRYLDTARKNIVLAFFTSVIIIRSIPFEALADVGTAEERDVLALWLHYIY